MKTIKNLVFILITNLGFSNCEPVEDNGNGNITVTVPNQVQSTIHIKSGTLQDPNLPLEQCDRRLSVDALGQAHFNNLPPNDYYIYGKSISGNLKGNTSITVTKRFRQNAYAVTVNLK